mgnify:CR=1 FL=1
MMRATKENSMIMERLFIKAFAVCLCIIMLVMPTACKKKTSSEEETNNDMQSISVSLTQDGVTLPSSSNEVEQEDASTCQYWAASYLEYFRRGDVNESAGIIGVVPNDIANSQYANMAFVFTQTYARMTYQANTATIQADGTYVVPVTITMPDVSTSFQLIATDMESMKSIGQNYVLDLVMNGSTGSSTAKTTLEDEILQEVGNRIQDESLITTKTYDDTFTFANVDGSWVCTDVPDCLFNLGSTSFTSPVDALPYDGEYNIIVAAADELLATGRITSSQYDVLILPLREAYENNY